MTTNVKMRLTAEDKTKRAFQSVNRSLTGVSSSVSRVLAGFAPLIGAAGFGALTAQSLKSVDALAKTADKLTITTESLASLQLLTDLYSSASAPAMSEALTKATKRLGEFNATGGGAAAKWLEKLNLDTAELATLKPDELFKRYAESVRGLNDRGQQLAAMSALMGDESRALIGIIDAGADVFDDAAETVDKFGTGIRRLDASRIEDANDSITLMQESIKGLGIEMGVKLAPHITRFINWMLDIEESLSSLSEEQLVNRLTDIGDRLEKINNTVDYLDRTGNKRGLGLHEERLELLLKEAELEERLNNLRNKDRGPRNNGAAGTTFGQDQLQEEQQRAAERLQFEEDNDRQRLAAKFERLNISLLSEQDRLRFDLEEKEFIIEEAFQQGLATDAERKEVLLAINQEYEDKITESNQKALDSRVEAQARVNQKIGQMQLALAHQSIGFLNLVAGKNKAVGKLIIVAQKGLAIAQATISTEVAAVKALELGPVYGPPAAATMRALGAVSIALIAGTGIVQLAGKREQDGPVSQNLPYLVGERGPEIFTPNSSGNIISNKNIENIGGPTNIINVSVNTIDSESFDDRLGRSAYKIWNIIMDQMNEEGLSWR